MVEGKTEENKELKKAHYYYKFVDEEGEIPDAPDKFWRDFCNRFDAEAGKRLLSIAPMGSRAVMGNPNITDESDFDYVVTMEPGVFLEFHSHLWENGFEQEGGERYSTSDFLSYRKNQTNFIVVLENQQFVSTLSAVSLCNKFKVYDRDERIEVYEEMRRISPKDTLFGSYSTRSDLWLSKKYLFSRYTPSYNIFGGSLDYSKAGFDQASSIYGPGFMDPNKLSWI